MITPKRPRKKPVKLDHMLRVIERPHGRPFARLQHLSIESMAPWRRLGISRRSWYRHHKKAKAEEASL